MLMGSAMLATGLVTSFPALLATQGLWGLSWTFASGADVAWLTDELDRPDLVPRVLVRAARAQLIGSVVGIVVLGVVAGLIGRASTMVLAGVLMLALGLYVAFSFGERHFVPVRRARAILVGGTTLVRRSRRILLIFAATFAINGALDAYGRMYPLRLIDTGFPAQPLVWFAGLNVLILLGGALALRSVARRVHDVRVARRAYIVACLVGAVGVAAFAAVSGPVLGAAAVVLVSGTAEPVTRTIGTIWVNRWAESGVRATVNSFLAQAEYAGEIVCGAAIALVAAGGGTTAALLCCSVLLVAAAIATHRAIRLDSHE
jgi:hypothetical protein